MEINNVVVSASTAVILREVVAFENLGEYFNRASSVLEGVCARAQVSPQAFRAYTFGMPEGSIDIAAGFTVNEVDVDKLELPEGVSIFRNNEVSALRGVLQGSYQQLPAAWQEVSQAFADSGLTPGSLCFEEYLNTPGDTPEADLITHIVWEIA